MKIIKKITLLQKHVTALRRRRRAVGLVPTMGYLHEGHLSLMRRARRENDAVIVSIFVNPLQFGPAEDFKQYPRDLSRDLGLLRAACDIAFAPSAREMFPDDFTTFVEVKGYSDLLCGGSRPGHFVGVATVVCKLLNIIGPDRAYFGQKDAQQAVIIRKLAKDLNVSVAIRILPTVREKDGLAMSSRNAYLSSQERQEAVVLFQALKSAERLVAGGQKDPSRLIAVLRDFIGRSAAARVDYIEVVDKETLRPVKKIEKEALLALAVYIGGTRLIDNTLLRAR